MTTAIAAPRSLVQTSSAAADDQSQESKRLYGYLYRPSSMTDTSNVRPWDAYIRVSRVGGRLASDGFISPDLQRAGNISWADKTGIPIWLHEPELNVSGGSMDRPVLNRVLQRIRSGESAGLVVYTLDRFSRDLTGAVKVFEQLDATDAGFASATQEIDTSTPMGRAGLQFMLTFAELTRGTLREGWEQTTTSAIDRGIHICNNEPVGYSRDRARRFVPNEFAAAVVEVFELRAQGVGWRRLATKLDTTAPLFLVDQEGELWQAPLDDRGEPVPEEGLPPRRPVFQPFVVSSLTDAQLARARRGYWTANRVQRLVKKRVYRGEAHYREKVNPEAHPPLVSEALYQRAAAAAGVTIPRKAGKVPGLLRGVARCASCRYLLQEGNSRCNGGLPAYRCNRTSVAGPCPHAVVVDASELEEAVVHLMRQHFARIEGTAVPASTELHEAKQALDDANHELRSFVEDTAQARTLRRLKQYDTALQSRVSDVDRAQMHVDALSVASPFATTFSCDDWSFDFDSWWLAADQNARRRALASCIDTVFVRGKRDGVMAERAVVLWRGQGPDDLPRRGRENGPIRGHAW